jgi:2-dehydropantoate 2-reductase
MGLFCCTPLGLTGATRHYRREGADLLRILVLGAGVIGSVYAGKLVQAGHEVVLLARGPRLVEVQTDGLVLEEAQSGKRSVLSVSAVSEPATDDRFDLVLVPVRAEQLPSTLPVLTGLTDHSDVLFFGNTANRQAELTAALGERAVFGFPAAGGTWEGSAVRYVLISQQKTMLGEVDGTTSPRVRHLQSVLNEAGLPTLISANIEDWLVAHAAFVVPIAFALYRVGVDPARLAADPASLRVMVLATREAFTALRAKGNDEIPTNLRILYRLPTRVVSGYWRRVLNSPRGELWFGAHSRAAPEEMRDLAEKLQETLLQTGHPTPDLNKLLTMRL